MSFFVITAIILYFTAAVLYFLRRRKLFIPFFVVAWVINCALVGQEWVSSGQPPFKSMYHVFVFMGCVSMPLYGVLAGRHRLRWLTPLLPLAGGMPLGAALLFKTNTLWRLAPALQSPWFVPHVAAYMISYSLALIAFILLLMTFATRLTAKWSAHTVKFEKGSYELISLAFPLMTFGLFSGALWANQAWGDYWSWDPKEVWALITWTLYLIYFHCRKSSKLRGYVNLVHLLAFTALLATFLIVNLYPKLSSALHSYV